MRKTFSLLLLAAAGFISAVRSETLAPPSGWSEAGVIAGRIVAPTFPVKHFSIASYGAVGDGKTDCTEAIRQAIAACHEAGGGHVVVPAGVFLTGAIHLLSNVDLHTSAGSTLFFKTDPAAYLPAVFTRWEGTECYNYSALVYAFEQENIAVTGEGTLDGQAGEDNWWAWAKKSKVGGKTTSIAAPDREALAKLGDTPEVKPRRFGAGHFLRPNFIQTYRCKNVLIDRITLLRSPMWEVHPVLCTNVIVRNVKIDANGPNNDGCDPESCRDVLIEGCIFNTGDDCIAIKSGRNGDGRRINVPAENIIIRRCAMRDGHGGVTIGSEISGGCRNVYVEDCTMDSPQLYSAIRFKSNAARGGVIENVFVRNLRVGRVGVAVIAVEFRYEEGPAGSYPPVVRNVDIENLTSDFSPRALSLDGIPNGIIDDIRVKDCVFHQVAADNLIAYATHVELTNVKLDK